MKTKRIIISISLSISIFLFQKTYSQDHHFSQFDATLQALNPALSGMSWGNEFAWRANTSYRSQWRGIATKPFNNQLLSFDMPYKGFGIGGYLLNTRSGAGFLNTLNFMVGGAYEITIDPKNEHNLFGGLQIGLLNRSIRIDNLIFDSQYSYSTNSYDANIPSGEVLENKSIYRFDANMGFYYKYRKNGLKVSPHVGLSLFHVTMPNESFTSEKSRMPLRYVLTGGCEYHLNEQMYLQPNILTMIQAKTTDLVFSALYYYKINDTPYQTIAGVAYRNKDAVIIHLGIKYFDSIFRLSYDLNTSYLKNYTHGKGGLEISIIYVQKAKKSVQRTIISG